MMTSVMGPEEFALSLLLLFGAAQGTGAPATCCCSGWLSTLSAARPARSALGSTSLDIPLTCSDCCDWGPTTTTGDWGGVANGDTTGVRYCELGAVHEVEVQGLPYRLRDCVEGKRYVSSAMRADQVAWPGVRMHACMPGLQWWYGALAVTSSPLLTGVKPFSSPLQLGGLVTT